METLLGEDSDHWHLRRGLGDHFAFPGVQKKHKLWTHDTPVGRVSEAYRLKTRGGA